MKLEFVTILLETISQNTKLKLTAKPNLSKFSKGPLLSSIGQTMSPKYFTKTSLNCGKKSGYQERTHGHGKNMYTPQLLFLPDFDVLKAFWLRWASWSPNCDFVGCSQNPPNRNNSAGHVCHITFWHT